MLDPNRRIYPNAPLQLVAFQLQFPPSPVLDDEAAQRDIYQRLRDTLPILGAPPFLHVEVNAGSTTQAAKGIRLLDRQRTTTVALATDSLAIETSRYTRYEEFAELIGRVLHEIDEVGVLSGVTRLGLRYIDEIVVDGVLRLEQWRGWINDDLLVGGILDDYETIDYRGAAVAQIDEGHQMAVRFGVLSEPVVNPQGPLRIPSSPTGPYFLLDIDSYWDPSADELPEFNAEEVLAICERLHQPILNTFERAITDQLRDRFAQPPATPTE
jgi:uncharacterized protein (TIGR04255 family)